MTQKIVSPKRLKLEKIVALSFEDLGYADLGLLDHALSPSEGSIFVFYTFVKYFMAIELSQSYIR